MRPVVVDASVAAKWFFPEAGSQAALRLLDGRRRLLAPELIFAEFGNIVWKRHRQGQLNTAEARELVDQFVAMPLEIHETGPLLPSALDLALSTDRSVYDCLYIALAVAKEARVVTADERLVNALARGPLARHIRRLSRTR